MREQTGKKVTGIHVAVQGATVAEEHSLTLSKTLWTKVGFPKPVHFEPDYGSELPMGLVENRQDWTPWQIY